MRALSLVQGSPEWLTWRSSGIGASDAPVIEGNSPYRTVLQLYREKIGEPNLDEEEGKEFIFGQGHKAEDLVRKQFQELTGVEMKPLCAIHDKFDYILASLDGFDPKLGTLEAKLVGQAVLAEAKTSGTIPAHHFTQMQHQFDVTGADVGQWFGHDGKKNGALIEVRADLEYIKRLRDKEHAFWAKVVHRDPPALSDRDYLTPDDLTLLAQLRDAKEQSENSAIYYAQLRNKIVEKYKHPRISGAGIKVFRVIKNGSISDAAVPELAEILAVAEKRVEEVKKTLDPKYLEQFRSKGSTSWSVTIEKAGRKNG